MNKNAKKKLRILICSLIVVLIALVAIMIPKNEPAKNTEPGAYEEPMNPEDQYDGRTPEQIEAYEEFKAEQDEVIKALDEAKNVINMQIKAQDSNSIYDKLGNILCNIGRNYTYEKYSELDTKELNKLIDEYLTQMANNDYVAPEFESTKDTVMFGQSQDVLDKIEYEEKDKNKLFVETHNALLDVCAYCPAPEKLNWTIWLLAAQNCDFFNYKLENNDTLFNSAFTVVYADDDTINAPTTKGASIELLSTQTARVYNAQSGGSDVTNSSTANNSRYLRVSGTEQKVLIQKTGLYKFELVGGGGGSDLWNGGGYGGNGGTTTVYKYLTKDTILYVNVGGNGYRTAEGGRTYSRDGLWAGWAQGGYNGGGVSSTRSSANADNNQGQGGSGGGATSISLQSGTLDTLSVEYLIAVAGGGGGAGGIDVTSTDGTYKYVMGHGGGGGGSKGSEGLATGRHTQDTTTFKDAQPTNITGTTTVISFNEEGVYDLGTGKTFNVTWNENYGEFTEDNFFIYNTTNFSCSSSATCTRNSNGTCNMGICGGSASCTLNFTKSYNSNTGVLTVGSNASSATFSVYLVEDLSKVVNLGKNTTFDLSSYVGYENLVANNFAVRKYDNHTDSMSCCCSPGCPVAVSNTSKTYNTSTGVLQYYQPSHRSGNHAVDAYVIGVDLSTGVSGSKTTETKNYLKNIVAYGGSQTKGGEPVGSTSYNPTTGTYGKGGDSNTYSGGGGGGGLYGGAGGVTLGNNNANNAYSTGGGGGSGYIPEKTTVFRDTTYINEMTVGAVSSATNTNPLSGTDVSHGSCTITLVKSAIEVPLPYEEDVLEYEFDNQEHTPINSEINTEIINVTGTTSATNAGEYTATLTIKDESSYEWAANKANPLAINWEITPRDLSNTTIADIGIQYIEASAVTPEIQISDEDIEYTLVKDVDYTLVYANNDAEGTGTVTITGIGNYKGVVEKEFQIYKSFYNITYILSENAINNIDNPATYRYTDDTIVLGKPIKYGFDFEGWEPEGVIESGSHEDKVFTAVWAPASYSYEGSAFKKGEGAADALVVASIYYSDLDYAFAHTPLTNACREGVEIEPEIVKYTLTYELDGGTISSNTNVEVDAGDYVTLETPSKAGWNFIEYNSSPNGDGERYEGDIQITNNLTVYAIYSQTQYRYATAKSYSNNLLSEVPTAEAYKEITIYGYQDAETYSSITSTKPDGYYKTGSGQNAVCGTTQECTRTEDNLWDCCPKCGNDGLHDQSMGGCRHNYVCVASRTVNKSCTYYYPVATWGAENWAQTVSENNSFTEVNATSGTPRKALSKTGYQIASEYNSFSSWQDVPIASAPDRKIETRVAYNYQSN